MYQNLRDLGEKLEQSLRLVQPPVAISFTDSLPPEIRRYSDRVPAGCRFWQEGARSVFWTSSPDHGLCAIGVYTHGLESPASQQKDLVDSLRVFASLGYVRDEDIPLIPILDRKPKYVVYAPLGETPLAPDVVLLFVDAAQSLIVAEAVQQVENQNAPAMGRPACAVIPQTANSGRAALSLGCCGARAYLDTLKDDVAVFAIPGSRLNEYVDRIQVLANANSVLSKFHQIRKQDVSAGNSPTVEDSLAALRAS